MRRLLVPFSALVLAAGCGKTEETVKAECEPEVIDLSACDRGTLAAVEAKGIWNMQLVYSSDGLKAPSVIRFSDPNPSDDKEDKPLIAGGLPISETRVGGDSFFVFSDTQDTSSRPVRYVFAGCSSPAPGQVKGQFRRCTNGTKDLEGTFEAHRLGWREGEAEASGLELLSERAMPRGAAADVFVAGGHAYVAALGGGLFVYNVSDPSNPVKVAEVTPANDSWSQVWVHGTTAYIASAARGILVYNVTDPKAPGFIKALPDAASEVRSLFVEGSRLYAASPSPRADVLIYDISTPDAPTLLKSYFVEDSNPSLGERPLDVFAQGDRLYVSHSAYGLAVVDMSDPKAPKKLGQYKYEGATTRSTVVGAVGSQTLAFEAGEDWGAHLRILNVGSPESITQVGEYKLRPQVSIRSLALSGTKLYMAHYQDGLRILDVSNPAEPLPRGYFNSWRETDAGRGLSFFEGLSGVRVPGDGYVYATDTARGLLILKETN